MEYGKAGTQTLNNTNWRYIRLIINSSLLKDKTKLIQNKEYRTLYQDYQLGVISHDEHK